MRAARGFRQAVLAVLLVMHAWPAPAAEDPYAAGLAAFEREDWEGVLAQMRIALQAQPRANAHSLMGFAYRKLGDHPAALASYDQALVLAPYHRGALEGLGEAWLELDRPDHARAALDRLAEACRRLAHAAVDPLSTCAEWQRLARAYEAYVAGPRSTDPD